jgi:hypothetical protein
VVRGARIYSLVLDRDRRWLERHDAGAIHERLLVLARTIPRCPTWRRNKSSMLVQWLLLLPEHESMGRVVTWCSQESLRMLLSHRYRAGVHGDVPLPQVDIRRPWRSGPAIVAGGSSRGRGGVAKVTITVASAATILVVIPAIAAIVVLVLIFVVVGWSGQRRRLRLRSQRHSAGVERGRSSGWPSGVQVDLL